MTTIAGRTNRYEWVLLESQAGSANALFRRSTRLFPVGSIEFAQGGIPRIPIRLRLRSGIASIVIGSLGICISTHTASGRPLETSGIAPELHFEATDSAETEAPAGLLKEVVVTAYRFLAPDTRGTTNLPLAVEEVPQSISIVNSDFIEAANLKTLGEVAEYTAGAINSGNPANNGTVIQLRGFSSGRAVDGLPIPGGTSYEPEYAIYDRLEVVKGPTSVVYGVSTPGGLVNFVTKSAPLRPTDYVRVQVGSWDGLRVEGQLSGSLDSAGHIRAIGVAVRDQGDSFQDIAKRAKTSVYGGINVDMSESLDAYLHGGFERYTRTGFDGIPTEADGSPAPLPRSFYIGSPRLETTSSIYHAEGGATWHITDKLEFSVKGNYEGGENKGSTVYGYGLQSNGDISLAAFRFDLPDTGTGYHNHAVGVSSIYYLDSLGLTNSFVSLSALYQDSLTGFSGVSPPAPYSLTRNVFDGEDGITQALDSLVASAVGAPYSSWHKASTSTYSAQSVLKPAESLSLLLGVAYSNPKLTIEGSGGNLPFNFGSEVSYRAGMTYEVVPGGYAYASFSQSFSPQELVSLGEDGAPHLLPPLEGEQYEIGFKFHRLKPLLVTGTIFQIKQRNVGQYDQSQGGADYYKPIGEVTHRGVELETVGQLSSQWQINAAYAYLDARVSEDSNTALIGQRSLYLPRHTWSLFTTYALPASVLRGMTLGAGLRHIAPEQTSYRSAAANAEAGLPNTIDLGGYSLVDLSANYAKNNWLLQLNARNIFDKHYFINNYKTLYYGNVVGDPTSLTLTIRRAF